MSQSPFDPEAGGPLEYPGLELSEVAFREDMELMAEAAPRRQSAQTPAPQTERERAIWLEGQMWRQRTKQLALLLCEARDRLAELHDPGDIELWLDGVTQQGWVADAKHMPSVPGNILVEIEEFFHE